METILTETEVRVLGCLIEKELATPEYYPLTLNALTNACNQKSNRDPAMQLEEAEVVRALDALRFKQLALLSAEGGRVPKYRHILAEKLRLSPAELAVLAELLVRGPQTVGELRTRKAGHVRQIDMHLVVPKGITVEEGHALSHDIIREIEDRLPHSQVLVHIEPCGAECEGCVVVCSYR